MSHISNIIKKEIREMLTPGSVISVLFMVILFAGLGGLIGGEVEKGTTLPEFGIIAEEIPYYEYTDADGNTVVWNPIDSLRSYYGDSQSKIVVMDSTMHSPSEDIIAEMEERGLNSIMVMPDAKSFADSMARHESVIVSQYYVFVPGGMFGSISSELMSSVIGLMNADLSEILITESGAGDYDFLTSPLTSPTSSINTLVNGEICNGVTPSGIANTISGQTMMIPMVIMIIIMMVGSIVISSMGSEKENKTLETLLTLPIARTSIVTGKIVAAAIVGLVYGLAYMVGMSIYMGSMTGMISSTGQSVDLASIGMSLDITEWALVMLSMFLAIVCALGICMILGAFSKNYKSAQTMTMPLSILAMIPMFIIMFAGWYGAGTALQAVCFAIPFSHPMIAMQALMYGDVTLVLAGIGYMTVFALITVLITVRLYSSDILITGLGQNKWVQKLTGRK